MFQAHFQGNVLLCLFRFKWIFRLCINIKSSFVYSSRGTGVSGLCTFKTLIKLLNIRCLRYALNSWKDQQNDNNLTACRSCQDSGGVNTVGTCGVEGFRDVCWMGVGKLIHIHRRQDCLLNPLKAWSGWETLMLPHITPYIYSCCWSVHGWHDHRQFLRQ